MTTEVRGCNEVRHAVDWCDKRGCQGWGAIEANDLLW